MDVRLLGELEVIADDGSAVAVRGVKARTLLAVLALHRGEPVGPDRLIDVLWGDDPPGKPANALQALVATARRAVGAEKILTNDAGYALAIRPDEVDVARFEALVLEGRRQLEGGDAVRAAASLRAALDLCRDEPLVEFAYAEFAAGERARLQELLLVAEEGRIEADLALGRHAELVGELESLCEHHALRERLWELRMLALYRSGRQADALRVYGDARERLVEEFGIEPGHGLRDLEARVLAQDPTLDAPAPPSPTMTRRSGNLRQRLTSFVGRDEDVVRLVDALASCRLVTLIGAGGAGKTRLAIEAAATVQREFEDGTWLVELAGVRDPEGVAPAIAAALELNRADGGGDSTLDVVVGLLRGRSLLVVLDNCEHLIGEAAVVAERLLGELPDLRVIATSREALGVPGELLFPVRGLALDAAVEVFVDRARAVRPQFVLDATTRPVVENVCRRLDGLPLAVELAAARLRALPLGELAQLLDDRFRVLTGGARTALPRQQTLRAVVDWSYDLLFEDERRLFARLSVFAGGWTLDAVEAVCSDELLPAHEILELLLRLVDKSLVVAEFDDAGEARYSQLETLAHYGRERLAETGEGDAVRERHARWAITVAAQARAGLRGKTGPACRRRLLAEWENLRAALDWAVDAGAADDALSLVEGVAWLWFVLGDPHDAVRWFDDALAVPGSSPGVRAAASMWHAYYAAWLPDPGEVLDELHAAIDVLRAAGRTDRLTDALLIAAELHARAGDRQATLAALTEAGEILEGTGDDWSIAARDYLYARSIAAAGELDEAEAAARASVARFRTVGEEWIILEGLGLLAIITESRGNLDDAAETFEELIAQSRAAAAPNYEAQWTARLAAVSARLGDDQAAGRLFAEVATSAKMPVVIAWCLIGRAGAVRRLGDPALARELLDEAMAICASQSLDVVFTGALVSQCWASLHAGDLDGAAALASTASRRAADFPSSRVATAAAIAAAAVTCARTGDPADRNAFLALVEQRDRFGAGSYDGLEGGSIGEHFDTPDVAAYCRSLGLELAAR